MRHGSLFSGIGGFDLASEWMGWTNVFHCEMNPFCNRVLNHHFSDAICYEDIKQTDFSVHKGQIDILTGGFPCQPYSAAGKRLGKEDDRHLWPEMLRAIREIQPCWVVGENVLGLVNWNEGLVFEEVQTDLEAQGYEVQPYVLPACAVNAPHRRDRVWFVAHSDNIRGNQPKESKKQQGRAQVGTTSAKSCRFVADTYGEERDGRGGAGEQEWQEREQRRDGVQRTVARLSEVRTSPDSDNGFSNQQKGQVQAGGHTFKRGGESNAPDGIRSTAWEDFPAQSPVCGGNDGLPGELDGITFSKWRNESIKAYGNAIVPQVVFQIFKAIERTQ